MSFVARRVLLLVVFIATVAVAAAWWRERSGSSDDDEPPSWPPLDPTTAEDPVTTSSGASAVSPSWRPPGDGVEPPAGFPVKAKDSSGIFHEPGGRFYDRTRPDRWYATADAAEADGYRRSKT